MSSLVSSVVDGLRRAGLVVLIGGISGIAVFAISTGGLQIGSWPAVAIVNSILVGILYVALLDGTVRLIRLIMEAFVPVRSNRAVIFHAVAPAAGTVVVFAALTAGLKTTLGPSVVPSWTLLAGAGALAALAVAAGSGFLALELYHQRDRKDHAEGWEARMRRLRTQTCPPILFETLSTVQKQIDEHPAEVGHLLEQLNAFLRYRSRAARNEPVRLADELEAVLQYVELAKLQYGEDLEVGFDIPESLLSATVPPLCLLPLLENAVQHGAGKLDEPCTITVTGRTDDAQLCLAVLDTGPGFDTTDPNTVLRRGSGIADLYARLREHFGSATDLSLLPQGVLWCAPFDHERTSPPSRTDAPAPRSS